MSHSQPPQSALTVVEQLARKHDVVQQDDPRYWQEAVWAYGDSLLEWAAQQPSAEAIRAGQKGQEQPVPDAAAMEPEMRPEPEESVL